MNIDTTIDRFVADTGIITNFNYFIPALYDHILFAMQNSLARGFGFEYYIGLVNIIQNDPIGFIRRYETKNDIIFDINDNEIFETINSITKHSDSKFINDKINEFRNWKMKQEFKDIVNDWHLENSEFMAQNFPEASAFIKEICSENNSNNK